VVDLELEMEKFFIGWDVGAWNCDKGDSRDALSVTAETKGKLAIRGRWRGNLRQVLDEDSGLEILRQFFRLCEIEPPKRVKATIAIDTPLGWPQPALQLLVCGTTTRVPKKADENPYLFRKTELRLFSQRFRPLSTVRDLIGSQSTKGIHFLKKAGLRIESVGVWSATNQDTAVTAIETYPAPCKRSPSACKTFLDVMGTENVAGSRREHDLQDALRCALIAWWFRADRSKLAEPSPDIPCDEGWIWLPKDVWTVNPDLG
jgi:hypothetical protein